MTIDEIVRELRDERNIHFAEVKLCAKAADALIAERWRSRRMEEALRELMKYSDGIGPHFAMAFAKARAALEDT
jgi:hypothetical protein